MVTVSRCREMAKTSPNSTVSRCSGEALYTGRRCNRGALYTASRCKGCNFSSLLERGICRGGGICTLGTAGEWLRILDWRFGAIKFAGNLQTCLQGEGVQGRELEGCIAALALVGLVLGHYATPSLVRRSTIQASPAVVNSGCEKPCSVCFSSP